jgi:diguanylate cyclase (GGDEF)-like protein
LLTALLAIGWIATGIALMTAFEVLRRNQRKYSELASHVEVLLLEAEVLRSQAYRDHLTGLANRALLNDRCQLAMERTKRSQTSFAILMVDLNRFKEINDNHGHAAGDYLLTVVAQRLASAVRTIDTVARLGGDEFVIVIDSVSERSELTRIGQKLIDRLSERITLESGVDVSVGASIGFAVYPDDGSTTSELLEVADQSMYQCKTSGLMPLF